MQASKHAMQQRNPDADTDAKSYSAKLSLNNPSSTSGCTETCA